MNTDIGLGFAWAEVEGALIAERKPNKTIGKYKMVFNRLFYKFPQDKGVQVQSPGQLNLIYLERYKVWYGQKAEPSGVRSELVMVKALIRRMNRLGFVDKAFTAELSELRTPRGQADENYFNIPIEKLRDLFAYIKNDNECFYDFFYYLLLTGRRPVESTLIERKDVEWHGLNPLRIIIRGEITKMHTNAPIEIHPTKDVALMEVIKKANHRASLISSPFLFIGKNGKRLSHTTLRNYLLRVSVTVLGQTINLKYFRKRYATECGRSGVPAKDAMRRSGHRDINVFIKHYQQATNEGLGSVIKAVSI